MRGIKTAGRNGLHFKVDKCKKRTAGKAVLFRPIDASALGLPRNDDAALPVGAIKGDLLQIGEPDQRRFYVFLSVLPVHPPPSCVNNPQQSAHRWREHPEMRKPIISPGSGFDNTLMFATKSDG